METLQQHQALTGPFLVEQSCLCWKQNAESRDRLCFWELPGMSLTKGSGDDLSVQHMLCVFVENSQKVASESWSSIGPCVMCSSEVLEPKLTQVQPQSGAVGLGWWGCQGTAQPGMSQECSLRNQCQGQDMGQERPQLLRSLSGKRGVRGKLRSSWSAGSNLQVCRRKESFSICAFSAIRPAKGKCFCDTRSALAEKDTNKNISTGSACF